MGVTQGKQNDSEPSWNAVTICYFTCAILNTLTHLKLKVWAAFRHRSPPRPFSAKGSIPVQTCAPRLPSKVRLWISVPFQTFEVKGRSNLPTPEMPSRSVWWHSNESSWILCNGVNNHAFLEVFTNKQVYYKTLQHVTPAISYVSHSISLLHQEATVND